MKDRIVWTVSQDGGKTVTGAYAGKNAKRLATEESGGKSTRMTEEQFRKQYTAKGLQVTTIG